MNHNTFERIREALSFIPVGGNYERWRVAAMIHSEVGEAGREPWDEWRGDRGNDDAASTWRSASKDGALKIGTLFQEAKANGWRDDGRYQKPTPEELAEPLSPDQRLRLNEARRSAEHQKLDAAIAHECHILTQCCSMRCASRELAGDRRFREARPDWMPYPSEPWEREIIAAKRLKAALGARYEA